MLINSTVQRVQKSLGMLVKAWPKPVNVWESHLTHFLTNRRWIENGEGDLWFFSRFVLKRHKRPVYMDDELCNRLINVDDKSSMKEREGGGVQLLYIQVTSNLISFYHCHWSAGIGYDYHHVSAKNIRWNIFY